MAIRRIRVRHPKSRYYEVGKDLVQGQPQYGVVISIEDIGGHHFSVKSRLSDDTVNEDFVNAEYVDPDSTEFDQ